MVDGKLMLDANLAAATDITDFIKKNRFIIRWFQMKQNK